MRSFMQEEWKVIHRRAKRRVVRRPRVYASLNKRGEIVLSAAAFEAFGGANVAILMFDEATQRIALRWPRGEQAYFRLQKHGRGGRGRVIRAKQMLDEVGLQIDETRIFTDIKITEFKEKPMIVLDLKTAIGLNDANGNFDISTPEKADVGSES